MGRVSIERHGKQPWPPSEAPGAVGSEVRPQVSSVSLEHRSPPFWKSTRAVMGILQRERAEVDGVPAGACGGLASGARKWGLSGVFVTATERTGPADRTLSLTPSTLVTEPGEWWPG